MNSSLPFTFNFSPYSTGSTANFSFIFFTIYNEMTGGNSVYDQGFLAATTRSLVLPGRTLIPVDTYEYELDYSNRDILAKASCRPQQCVRAEFRRCDLGSLRNCIVGAMVTFLVACRLSGQSHF